MARHLRKGAKPCLGGVDDLRSDCLAFSEGRKMLRYEGWKGACLRAGFGGSCFAGEDYAGIDSVDARLVRAL